MNRRSLESQRPIMAPSVTSKRTSKRYSTYSASPSFSTTYSNSHTLVSGAECANTPHVSPEVGMAEIQRMTQGLDKLENKYLEQQRYVPSQKKTDDLSKISLGAKVERALGRRMTNQDYVMKVKRPAPKTANTFSVIDEKSMLKV